MQHSAWSTVQGVSGKGRGAWNIHQGMHAGQGVRSTGPGVERRENGICDTGHGTKYMMQGQYPGYRARDSARGSGGPFSCLRLGPQRAAAGTNFLLSQRPISVLPPPPCLFGCQRVGMSQRSGAQGTPHHATSSDKGQGLGPSPWLRKSLPGPQIPSQRRL